MSVSMRLTRVGGKKDPVWRVVVADSRSPRDGRFIETIGRYNAQTEPSTIQIDEERVRHWLDRGAQPSDAVRKLLKTQGIQPTATRQPALRGLPEDPPPTPGHKPEQVRVEEFEEDDGTLVFELSVDDEDYGRVIGGGGRTAQALRTVVKAAAVKDNRRVLLDIVE